MIKATLEITDEQLLDVIAFVKVNKITAVFEGALLLKVGKKYKTREGFIVHIESEEYGQFRSGNHLYYANGRAYSDYESAFDLIEEVKEELPFEVVVGGVYEMRNGEIDEIILNNGREFYPFIGKSGRWYSEKGRLFSDRPTDLDLIKRIK